MVKFLKKVNDNDDHTTVIMKNITNDINIGNIIRIPKGFVVPENPDLRKLGKWYNEINSISNRFVI